MRLKGHRGTSTTKRNAINRATITLDGVTHTRARMATLVWRLETLRACIRSPVYRHCVSGLGGSWLPFQSRADSRSAPLHCCRALFATPFPPREPRGRTASRTSPVLFFILFFQLSLARTET